MTMPTVPSGVRRSWPWLRLLGGAVVLAALLLALRHRPVRRSLARHLLAGRARRHARDPRLHPDLRVALAHGRARVRRPAGGSASPSPPTTARSSSTPRCPAASSATPTGRSGTVATSVTSAPGCVPRPGSASRGRWSSSGSCSSSSRPSPHPCARSRRSRPAVSSPSPVPAGIVLRRGGRLSLRPPRRPRCRDGRAGDPRLVRHVAGSPRGLPDRGPHGRDRRLMEPAPRRRAGRDGRLGDPAQHRGLGSARGPDRLGVRRWSG